MFHFKTDRLRVEYINGKVWELLEDFTYVDDQEGGTGDTITVFEGFLTDFASLPRLVWNVVSPTQMDVGRAGVVHDWLYYAGEVDGGREITRKYADDVFKRALKELGCNWLRRQIIYASVRLNGGGIWKKYRSGGKRERPSTEPKR
jgi:hypothetical protein